MCIVKVAETLKKRLSSWLRWRFVVSLISVLLFVTLMSVMIEERRALYNSCWVVVPHAGTLLECFWNLVTLSC